MMGPGYGERHHEPAPELVPLDDPERGDPALLPRGWQIAYGKGQADMLLSLAMMPETDRERLLARARAQVVRVPMAPWDNPDAADPRIKVDVYLTADDTPEQVADKVDAALDDAVARGGNPADVRLDVQWPERAAGLGAKYAAAPGTDREERARSKDTGQ
jgi:hypothetical protein